jgi:nucleotide-binding universal stress UspA family protein
MFNKILVAVDESDHAHKAVDVAVDLATHYNSQLCLLHAFPHVADHLGSPVYDNLLTQSTMSGQKLLDEIRIAIADKKLAVDTQLLEGPPASAILRVAETEGYDLIVMGTRGHNAVVNLMLGSVSSAVSHKAHCPVMLIH